VPLLHLKDYVFTPENKPPFAEIGRGTLPFRQIIAAASGAADFGHADHMVVIQDMIEAINQNREVIIPVTSVRPMLGIVLAMYQSAARNQPVNLPVQDDKSIWDAVLGLDIGSPSISHSQRHG
jgi:hypothetical protein